MEPINGKPRDGLLDREVFQAAGDEGSDRAIPADWGGPSMGRPIHRAESYDVLWCPSAPPALSVALVRIVAGILS